MWAGDEILGDFCVVDNRSSPSYLGKPKQFIRHFLVLHSGYGSRSALNSSQALVIQRES
jgi:hypothetical protein